MPDLSQGAKKELLGLARATIAATLEGRCAREIDPSPELEQPAAAFVSLHKGGRLRGCIGTLEARGPLHCAVAEMARSAAFHDPRFPPLRAEELDAVDLEISVLSPLRRIADPAEVEVGRHGLWIVQGGRRGVLLPQVPTTCGWDRETFLAQTCGKAGLPPDAWKKGAELYVFEAEVFGE
ncbi:MAG: AmmeMemoRadiSam system protein A [Deltaproteobacteria bacterium]|nr:AmmeMemoRadiSam system protein A [Deltaproteobacteria bacterium]